MSNSESSDEEISPENPSEEFNHQWLCATVRSIWEKYDYSSDEGGKWIMFIKKEDIDQAWKKAKVLYTQGDLWGIRSVIVTTRGLQNGVQMNGVQNGVLNWRTIA